MNINILIGTNIRNRRLSLGLSQEKLAEYSDLSTNFISKLEHSSEQNISINKLEQISKALNTDITSLVSPKNQNNNNNLTFSPNINLLLKQLDHLEPEKAERLAKYFSNIIDEL
ncbi:helix-turn-helix domain-containing protein [Ligilactobacillus pobuzihii]|uniref:HTH cro/C1-type domain-containing protein n=1 Tax=Ligilactobacillus pobuzihii TaxID=449659 RepID=A0A0R2L4S4_9LACO|nr:helix-turn-helix transcriptional regulator [Ligilactobacillus pobuzihii]KRK09797.1 hypothetical protein FD11_GL000500 [Ligilactobacillus pobuzihii E100301 = KCTC 13174]KRN96776.1 hypothetical protein IV66_GL000638 [Ligilactobacillus pobuzihii]GEN48636.1 hypothetical protein LPO01_14280 [Ligilactobacillus pobuzihii]